MKYLQRNRFSNELKKNSRIEDFFKRAKLDNDLQNRITSEISETLYSWFYYRRIFTHDAIYVLDGKSIFRNQGIAIDGNGLYIKCSIYYDNEMCYFSLNLKSIISLLQYKELCRVVLNLRYD